MPTMVFTLLILALLYMLVRLAFTRRPIAPDWSIRQSERQESHVYYYDRRGVWKHIQGRCRQCISKKAMKLRRKGMQIDEIVLGRRSTCEL
jgi:hypothetical protein